MLARRPNRSGLGLLRPFSAACPHRSIPTRKDPQPPDRPQLSDKEIDCRATLQGKAGLHRHVGQCAHQQRGLCFKNLIGHRDRLRVALFLGRRHPLE